VFVDTERVPLPTKADLSFILLRRVAIAVTASLSCQTLADAKEYQREIGLKSLISAVTELQVIYFLLLLMFFVLMSFWLAYMETYGIDFLAPSFEI
jgi:hypothetical protein